MLKQLSAALFLGAIIATPALSQQVEIDEVFSQATTTEFTAQIAGTYPARNEILVKVRNGDQFALPVAPGADLREWRENDVVNVTVTQGAVTEISPSSVAEPMVSYSVVTEEVAGLPDDAVARSVTYSLPVTDVTITDTSVTFMAPDGFERTAVIAEDVKVETIESEFVTLTYYEGIDVARR